MDANDARKRLNQGLDNVEDEVIKDNILSSDIKDSIVLLRANEAWQLTTITDKFRQELQRSTYRHLEVEIAIRLLEYYIQHYARTFNVDTLFIGIF